jgi:RNA recognition motif-containing protein
MKLYVGNLSYDANEDDLQDLVGKHGEAVVKVITDRDSGRSKGFAFVEYTSQDQADAAIGELDGFSFKGRPLRVSAARPKTDDRPPRRDGGGGGRGGGGGGYNRR